MAQEDGAVIEELRARAYRIPTEVPESDGTHSWTDTTLVVVEASGGGCRGLGYTYGSGAIPTLIREVLVDAVVGRDALAIDAVWWAMARALRNIGRRGIAMMALSAVDVALWDLKARVLGLPLVDLLGSVRDAVPIYASGGFTSLSILQLEEQLGRWVASGIDRVKMKVGRDPQTDPERVRTARKAIGPTAELFVDANGAYDRKQALRMAEHFAASGVSWLEEPVSSEDLAGLRLIRERGPASMEIAAGEYASDLVDFRRMLEAGAVDVLMPDATRCGGYSGFLRVAAVCEAFEVPMSTHTAPALHVPLGCAVRRVRHLEYFHDHARIERMLFDGVQQPAGGSLVPERSRPGLGLEIKEEEALRFEV